MYLDRDRAEPAGAAERTAQGRTRLNNSTKLNALNAM